MLQSTMDRLVGELVQFDPTNPQYAAQVVDQILSAGRASRASDLHLLPTADGLRLTFRIDGVLRPITTFPVETTPNIIARLKVLAQLLTYQTDSPQEGRIRNFDGRDFKGNVEMRVSTFPTLHGEKAVVRLFGGAQQFQQLDDLGLHADLLDPLRQLLGETSGAILVSGPAGAGKTTTAYACLRELADRADGARNLVSLEDPIEVAVDGVAQSQIDAVAGLDLATGIRFLLRQDPEVIMVGEIRDRATAEAALQAALTGQLLLSTFHAGSAAETIGRLLDMGIEPYVLRSGLLTVLCQRLVRKLCSCAEATDRPDARLGLPVERVMTPVGCDDCGGTGYRGRLVLVEMLSLRTGGDPTELARAILDRKDTSVLEQRAVASGMVTRWQRAREAVQAGLTSPAEVRRVLGFSEQNHGLE